MKKEKKVRQYRSRQGRCDKQYQSSMAAFTIAIVGIVFTLILNMFI
tara:strand:- start:1030 stop:1167 length:138 start_codon:yes stop_codon:yes gene_type:complete